MHMHNSGGYFAAVFTFSTRDAGNEYLYNGEFLLLSLHSVLTGSQFTII